jgi:uroporphyrin-III C-methyltransferase
MNPIPTVWLVGAGPGDPELLTLRAVRVLREADLVLCDDLVDDRVLEHVNPAARVLKVGKRGGCISTDQRFIHSVMIREAHRGLRVVRLKGGDPFVFGRGGEECAALREAGMTVEVVSGITSGIAAPAAIGVPVTDRRFAPGVAFVTGHVSGSGLPIDWASLARSRLTLVVYMGVARCEAIVAALREGGLPVGTPAAVISAAHTPRQRHAFATLATLSATVAAHELTSPAILVIGDVILAATELGVAEPVLATKRFGIPD